MDPLYWRLYYADDHVEDEPADNSSIRLSRPGALVLAACRPLPGGEREPVNRVDLFDGTDRLYKPVWYRKRSLSVNGPPRPAPRLEVTVMGRVREGNNALDGTLWASLDGLTFVGCPPWAEDPGAVEGMMLSA